MMRADTLNGHDYGGYTEMTALSSNVYSTDVDKSKRIIAHETLSQSCSTDEGKSKRSIVNKILLQNFSTDKEESKRIIVHETLSQSCSTDEDESKQFIMQKTLSKSCSTDEDKSKRSTVNKTLSQNCSADEDGLSSTEEDKSECAIREKKTQIMMLHTMCQTVLTPLTYSNVEERFWTDLTCHMKECAWRSNQQSVVLHTPIPRNRLTS